MIDYTKIIIPDYYAQFLLKNQLLSFERNINEDTGELDALQERTAEFEGMKFKIYPSGRIILQGSWHKYANKGMNYSDFKLTCFRAAVAEFCERFALNPNELRLLQLEVGVNIEPPARIETVLRSFICCNNGRVPFSEMRSRVGNSLGIEMYRTEYGVKVYNKSKQYNLPKELLRFELKFTCSKKIRREMSIETLADLTLFCKWYTLAQKIRQSLGELIMREPSINLNDLPSFKRNFLIQASNYHYWRDLNRRQRMRSKVRLQNYVEQFGHSDLKSSLQKVTREKLNLLTA